MILLPRFSKLVYGLLLVLHCLAALAVFYSSLGLAASMIMFVAVAVSLGKAHSSYGPNGRRRWRQCQLGESSCRLQSGYETLRCKPVVVSYFSEYLIILSFEVADAPRWSLFSRYRSLVIAPDTLDSRQQSQLRRFLLHGDLVQ